MYVMTELLALDTWPAPVTGAFIVDCRSVYSVEQIIDLIAQALSFPSDLKNAQALKYFLTKRAESGPLLLLLDNVEDVLDEQQGDGVEARKLLKVSTSLSLCRYHALSVLQHPIPTLCLPHTKRHPLITDTRIPCLQERTHVCDHHAGPRARR